MMTCRNRRTLCVAIVATLMVVAGCPSNILPTYTVLVTKDVVYGVGYVTDGAEPVVWTFKDLLLDVYEPEGAPATGNPALILVHGGSFAEESKEQEEMVEYARYFAQRGFVCFSIDYRLVNDWPPAPGYWDVVPLTSAAHAAMVDVKAAVRYVRANAAAYGVDPDKIALLGESAGAIAGVTVAVTNPHEYETDGPGFPVPEPNNFGVSPRVQAYVHLWGSADHVLLSMSADDPPTMIVHGDDDDNPATSFGSSERFHFALELLNIPHEFYEADGFGHGAWDYRLRGQGIKSLALDFLEEHLVGS